MELHAIVQQLYTDRRVTEFISKQQPAELREDLLHHCIMELYRIATKYPGKVEDLWQRGELWPWFHGMACNQLRSAKSTFFSKFRRQYIELESANLRNLPDDLPTYLSDDDYNTAISKRNGSNFASYVAGEVERQEKERLSNFGLKMRKTESNQLQLF